MNLFNEPKGYVYNLDAKGVIERLDATGLSRRMKPYFEVLRRL